MIVLSAAKIQRALLIAVTLNCVCLYVDQQGPVQGWQS